MRRWVLGLGVLLLLVGLVPGSHAQIPPYNAVRGFWTCTVDNVGTTLTLCQDTPAAKGFLAGNRYWITGFIAQSTTATAGLLALESGTGSNCGTGTAFLIPASPAAVVRYAYAGNTAAPTMVFFQTPIAAPLDSQICALGVVTNTLTITIFGFVNP